MRNHDEMHWPNRWKGIKGPGMTQKDPKDPKTQHTPVKETPVAASQGPSNPWKTTLSEN